MVDAVTLLHVSDPQFGKNHIFGGNGDTPADQAYDTLVVRLKDDLEQLRDSHGLRPDLMVVTGDLTEWARPAEFDEVRRFLVEVSEFLGLPRDRVVIVPGNHDISRDGCEAYFLQCRSNDEQPIKPYWAKWRQYLTLFEDFYRDVPGVSFQVDQEWSLFEMPDLRLVVAGLNSTMAESHLDDDHYGQVGEAQCRWFADRVTRYEQDGWLRIGAVHHNPIRGATGDDENLRDVDTLDRYLGRQLDLLLHGHTHNSRLSYLDSRLPVVSTGSTAVAEAARPTEVPNQYQVLRLGPEEITRYARQYSLGQKRWIGDTRGDPAGSDWRVSTPWPGVRHPRPGRAERGSGEDPAALAVRTWSIGRRSGCSST